MPLRDPAIGPERFVRHDGRRVSIVFQAETCVELGHPSVASASLLLSSTNEHDVNNNQITVLGNDIARLEKGRYSFAQILLVGGLHFMPEHLSNVRTLLGATGNLDGCMVRLMGEKMWVRISGETVAKGFSFDVWGHYLFDTIRAEVPAVERLEAVFVVGVDTLVDEISQLAKTVSEKRRQKLLERLKHKGSDYECENPYDCEECPDKPECDTLKEVAGVIKRKRV
jgi:CO dehydrogenase/acetyl-CoA synthase beta subunit